MRIVHVVESLDLGGLEKVVLGLAAMQAAQGHQVRIVCLWHLGALGLQAAGGPVQIVCVGKRTGFDPGALHRLRRAIRDHLPDVLHTHNAMAHYYAVAAVLGGLPKCLLNTRHGMGPDRLAGRGEWFYRQALRATDHAVSVCGAAASRFVEHGMFPAAKSAIVPNGIDLARFRARDPEASQRMKASKGLPPGALVFGTVGRLNETKQQHLLLSALRTLLDDGVDAVVVIAGDGELLPELERQCRETRLLDRVRLLGARSDVEEVLASLDVFVLPSRTEGYSLALVEACAAALPIVASDTGGNGEIVKDGHNGLLVPPGNAQRLAAAMKTLTADPAQRAAFGRAGRAWALQEGSMSRMHERYMALYLNRHQPDPRSSDIPQPAGNG